MCISTFLANNSTIIKSYIQNIVYSLINYEAAALTSVQKPDVPFMTKQRW